MGCGEEGAARRFFLSPYFAGDACGEGVRAGGVGTARKALRAAFFLSPYFVGDACGEGVELAVEKWRLEGEVRAGSALLPLPLVGEGGVRVRWIETRGAFG